jgi:uncharacterized protein YcaQ
MAGWLGLAGVEVVGKGDLARGLEAALAIDGRGSDA